LPNVSFGASSLACGTRRCSYLEALYKYLRGFLQRAQPLTDVDAALAPKLATFESQWAAGTVRGWETESAEEGVDRRLFCVACACGSRTERIVCARRR